MEKSRKVTLLTLVTLLLFSLTLPVAASENEETTIDTADYAPGLFYPFYDYEGVGMEFAPFTLTLDYEPDEDGIYQVSRATSGTTISHVYQLTDEGIYELAYFPESYDGEDFRYHDDALDEQVALVFPATLAVGDTFARGYRKDQEYTVTDILPEYELDNATYQDVLVIEAQLDDDQVQRYYYAPQIGEIASEQIYDADGNSITTSLSYFGEIPE